MRCAREGERKFESGNLEKIEAFFRPSTLKTKKFKKILMVAYLHIEYSTYQFSEELKGGGIQIKS